MIQNTMLARQYLRLAERLEEEGAHFDAMLCATRAWETDPGSRNEGPLRVLQEAVMHGLSSAPQESPSVVRLRRFKQRLDELAEMGRAMTHPLEADLADSPGTPQSLPAEIRRELHRLERRYKDGEGKEQELAYRLARRLLERFSAAEPIPDETAGDDTSGGDGHDWPGGWLDVKQELHNLGNDFYKADRHTEGIECYDVVLEIDPRSLETLFNRALSHTRTSNYEQAAKDLAKVIELDSSLPEVYYTLGLVREYQGDYRDAVAQYDKALETDPDYTKAHTQRDVALGKLASSVESCKRGDDADDSHVKDFARFLTKPDLKLADVGGHFLVKRRLHQVLAYLKGDPAMLEWGAEIPRGILLVGPPGVGKTHLAMCLAGEAKCPFYDPPMSIFEDKWAGNEQKSLRRLFDQACQHQQAIIHFSEFDSLGAARVSAHDGNAWYNRVVGCLLDLFDALARRPNRVVVIATSNYRENIDKAFLRPGRFSYTIELGLPTARELAEIWLIHLDTAARRAERLDFMTDELVQAVQADRQTWVQRAFAPDGEDPCGIVPLANLSERKGLVGDDVRECIRRVIDERVIASVECNLDLGPIGPRDLMEQLQSYIAARIADG